MGAYPQVFVQPKRGPAFLVERAQIAVGTDRIYPMAAEKLCGGNLLTDLLSNFVPVGIFGGAVPVFGGGSFQFFFESVWISGFH